MATVTTRYGGSTVTHGVTAVHISSTALPANTSTGYDADNYPASPEVTYYFSAELTGQDPGVSQVFAPNGGKGYWEGWVPPAAGTWTIHVRKVSDDSSVANTPLVVA
jgi:hypothetical protein